MPTRQQASMRPRELPAEDSWGKYDGHGIVCASMRPRELPAEDAEVIFTVGADRLLQ